MNFVDDSMLVLLLKIDTQHILFEYYNHIKLIISLTQLFIMIIILYTGTILSNYFNDARYSLYTALILIFMYILLFINRYLIENKYNKALKKMKALEERIDILSGKEVNKNEI